MFLAYKYTSVLNNSVYLECIYFVIITCHSSFHYKTNSISYRLIDLVWIDRMYKKKINHSINNKHDLKTFCFSKYLAHAYKTRINTLAFKRAVFRKWTL